MTAKEAAQAINQSQRDDQTRSLVIETAKELWHLPTGLTSVICTGAFGPRWTLAFGAMCFLAGIEHETKKREVEELERMVGK